MKKLVALLFFFLAMGFAYGQEQLDFRILSPFLKSGSPDSLVFTVQIRASVGSSCLRTTQLYIDYNTAAFGTNIVANGNYRIKEGDLVEDKPFFTGTASRYSVVNVGDNTSSKFTFVVKSEQESANCGADLLFTGSPLKAHATVPNTWTEFVQIFIAVSNGSQLPHVSWDAALSAGQQFFQTSSGAPQQAAQPDTFYNDVMVYPLEPFDIIWDGVQWTGTGSSVDNAPGPADATKDLLVETGTTDPLPVSAQVQNVIILDGGILDIGSNNLTITGSITGFTSSSIVGSGKIILAGSSAQTITGSNTWTNLEINNGNGVTILSGEQVMNGILLPTSGTLTTNNLLRCEASGTQNYSQIGPGAGSVSGDVTFEMIIAEAGWHNISSPISGATFADLEDDFNINYASAGANCNVYYWDASTANFVGATNSSTSLDGRGWLIYIDHNFLSSNMGVNGNGQFPVKLDITGSINDNSVNLANLGYKEPDGSSWPNYVNSNGFSNQSNGWNLIPNPYPSNLSWSEIASGFGSSGNNNTNGFFYIWNEDQGQYYFSDDDNIAPMQAVWVKFEDSDQPSASGFNLGDGHRTVFSPAQFYKSTPGAIRLDLIADTIRDFAIVRERAGASRDYNPLVDAVKQKSTLPDAPSLCFLTADSMLLALNSTAPVTAADTLPLGLVGEQGMSYTLNLADDQFNPLVDILLFDRKETTWTDLRALDYTFVQDSAFGLHRFDLVFRHSNIGIREGTVLPFPFSVKDKWIELDLSNEVWNKPAVLEVFNVAGQLLYRNNKLEAGQQFRFRLPVKQEIGVYILRLEHSRSKPPYIHKFIY